jgi:hypothetical protein
MALALYDRVQQTGTANTTVSFTLSGSVTGFQSFAVVGNTNTTYYSAFDASGNWETGLGTYSTTGPTLTRTTIYQSSNSNAAVTFSGTVNVFITYPSGKSVNQDESSNVTVPANFTLSGTAARITGDFSNATVANRVAFQTSTTNSSTSLTLISNGTGSQSSINIINNSDPTNAATLNLLCNASESRVNSGIFGTGTYLPLTIYTGGSERLRIDTSGNVGIGTSSPSSYTLYKATVLVSNGSGIGIQKPASGNNAYLYFGYDTTSGGQQQAAIGSISDALSFFTASTERMRINSSGGVSIGNTTDPGATNLSVTGTIAGSNITSGGNVTGSSASCTGNAATATTATNQSGGTVSATTVQATGGFTATSAAPFYLNATTVSANYTSPANYNLMSAGPITINTGVTVTIDTTGTWVIV